VIDRGANPVTEAVRRCEGPAVCAYVTAGYPSRAAFPEILRAAASAADVVEVGVPFTDPMADGLTIQRTSRVALADGATLGWALDVLKAEAPRLKAPRLLMGYYNPFLAFGLDRLGEALAAAGASGLIIPDLPLEESGPMRDALSGRGGSLVQLVAPTTSEARLQRLAAASDGFVYAVTVTGVTGGRLRVGDDELDYLRRVRSASALPVLAGFGVRTADDVAALAPHVDGVVVGSALLDAIDRGEGPALFIDGLRAAGAAA